MLGSGCSARCWPEEGSDEADPFAVVPFTVGRAINPSSMPAPLLPAEEVLFSNRRCSLL